MQLDDYRKHYSEQGFWQKLALSARRAGREVVNRGLQLYYASRRPDCPAWARPAIYGALGYLISTIDAVPDLTPVLGYVDDLGVITAALATVAFYVDDGVIAQAEASSRRLLGEEPA